MVCQKGRLPVSRMLFDEIFESYCTSRNGRKESHFVRHCKRCVKLDNCLGQLPVTVVPQCYQNLFLAHLSTKCLERAIVIALCPASVNNFFGYILLLNHWANLDETLQGCSL